MTLSDPGAEVRRFDAALPVESAATPRADRSAVVSGFLFQVTALRIAGKALYRPWDAAVVRGLLGVDGEDDASELLRDRITMGVCTLFCFFGVVRLLGARGRLAPPVADGDAAGAAAGAVAAGAAAAGAAASLAGAGAAAASFFFASSDIVGCPNDRTCAVSAGSLTTRRDACAMSASPTRIFSSSRN